MAKAKQLLRYDQKQKAIKIAMASKFSSKRRKRMEVFAGEHRNKERHGFPKNKSLKSVALFSENG
jgi:hypothetical protein